MATAKRLSGGSAPRKASLGARGEDVDVLQELLALRQALAANEARTANLEAEVAQLRRRCDGQAAEIRELRGAGSQAELRAYCEVGFDLRDAQIDLLSSAVDQVRREQGQHFGTLEKCLECCARAVDDEAKDKTAWEHANASTTDSEEGAHLRQEVMVRETPDSPQRDSVWSQASSVASTPRSTVAVAHPAQRSAWAQYLRAPRK